MTGKEIRNIIKKADGWVYLIDLVQDYGLSIAEIQKALRPKSEKGTTAIRDGYKVSSNFQKVRYNPKDWSYIPDCPLYSVLGGDHFYRDKFDASKFYDLPVSLIQEYSVDVLRSSGAVFSDRGGYVVSRSKERTMF